MNFPFIIFGKGELFIFFEKNKLKLSFFEQNELKIEIFEKKSETDHRNLHISSLLMEI